MTLQPVLVWSARNDTVRTGTDPTVVRNNGSTRAQYSTGYRKCDWLRGNASENLAVMGVAFPCGGIQSDHQGIYIIVFIINNYIQVQFRRVAILTEANPASQRTVNMRKRQTKERRHHRPDADYPFEDSNRVPASRDRRRMADRRLGNLAMEERQLLLSEIPWLIFKNWCDNDRGSSS
jgi:hypothetical protein